MIDPDREEFCGLSGADSQAMIAQLKSVNADPVVLDSAEAEKHESANVITRAVGVSEDLQVDCSTGEAAPGDLFLLASDGLTRLVDDDELLEELTAATPDVAADIGGAIDAKSFVVSGRSGNHAKPSVVIHVACAESGARKFAHEVSLFGC